MQNWPICISISFLTNNIMSLSPSYLNMCISMFMQGISIIVYVWFHYQFSFMRLVAIYIHVLFNNKTWHRIGDHNYTIPPNSFLWFQVHWYACIELATIYVHKINTFVLRYAYMGLVIKHNQVSQLYSRVGILNIS